MNIKAKSPGIFVRLPEPLRALVEATAEAELRNPAEVLRLLVMREAAWLESGVAPAGPLLQRPKAAATSNPPPEEDELPPPCSSCGQILTHSWNCKIKGDPLAVFG